MDLTSYTQGKKSSFAALYIEPGGEYTFAIKKIFTQTSRKGVPQFGIEFETLESKKIEELDRVKKTPTTPNPVGSCPSTVIALNSDTGPGNVLAILCAIADRDDAWMASAEGKKFQQDVAHPALQPHFLKPIKCTAWTVLTKKGDPFTVTRWEHVPMSPEYAAKRDEEIKRLKVY